MSLSGTGFAALAGGEQGGAAPGVPAAAQAVAPVAPQQQGDLMGGKGGLFRRLVGGALLGIAGGGGAPDARQAFGGGFAGQQANEQRVAQAQAAQVEAQRQERLAQSQISLRGAQTEFNKAGAANRIVEAMTKFQDLLNLDEDRRLEILGKNIADLKDLKAVGTFVGTQAGIEAGLTKFGPRLASGDLELVQIRPANPDVSGVDFALINPKEVVPQGETITFTGADGIRTTHEVGGLPMLDFLKLQNLKTTSDLNRAQRAQAAADRDALLRDITAIKEVPKAGKAKSELESKLGLINSRIATVAGAVTKLEKGRPFGAAVRELIGEINGVDITAEEDELDAARIALRSLQASGSRLERQIRERGAGEPQPIAFKVPKSIGIARLRLNAIKKGVSLADAFREISPLGVVLLDENGQPVTIDASGNPVPVQQAPQQ